MYDEMQIILENEINYLIQQNYKTNIHTVRNLLDSVKQNKFLKIYTTNFGSIILSGENFSKHVMTTERFNKFKLNAERTIKLQNILNE